MKKWKTSSQFPSIWAQSEAAAGNTTKVTFKRTTRIDKGRARTSPHITQGLRQRNLVRRPHEHVSENASRKRKDLSLQKKLERNRGRGGARKGCGTAKAENRPLGVFEKSRERKQSRT